MAKSKSFFGLRRGSTKSMTFSVLKGQQVTKDRVTDVANPRSMAQMRQRMPFASAALFYKRATEGLFKFAFENKKPLESDYNAFMRINAKVAPGVAYDTFKSEGYIPVAPFTITEGSLPTIPMEFFEDDYALGFKVQNGLDGVDFIKDLSKAMKNYYPWIQDGDIVTCVIVHSMQSPKTDGLNPDPDSNYFKLWQFVIDETSMEPVDPDFGTYKKESGIFGWYVMEDADSCGFNAVIVSRKTPDGLKVTTSKLYPGKGTAQYIEKASQFIEIDRLARTWGAAEESILQGSLAK